MYTNFNWNWFISYIQGHFNYFHSIVAKLCTTEYQSCQEPETLSVGQFFSKKVVRPLWNELNVFLVYLNMFTQLIAITYSMFNFGKFLTKNAITFDLTEIGRKKRYLASMKFYCASNAAFKNVKIVGKKINFFPKIFLTKSSFFQKIQIFRKNKIFFGFYMFFPSFWPLICLFRSNSKAIN